MKKDIAKKIDHTILKPEATETAVLKLCKEALEYEFASVCVNPYYVPFVAKQLEGSSVKTCAVVGFPLGCNPTEVKAFETEWVVKNGALEVDMVINIGALKNGNFDYVLNDIKAVVEVAKKTNNNALVKVIIEACLLTEAEKEKAINLCLEANADFVKTSTGFSTGGATVDDVKLMRKISADKMLVKASGGVKNYADLCKMVEAGADRIGTSNGIAIIEEV